MSSTSEEIKTVEERLDKRRELIGQRIAELKLEATSAASRATRSWPVVAVAGGLAAGYAISRSGRHRPHVAPHGSYAPVHRANGQSHMRAKGLIAAMLGIAATAIRISTSSEARMFVNAVKRYRDRHGHHRR